MIPVEEMPKEKKLSYLKCGRCRRDRQKCLPINRVESARCDRCIRYDYACSPSKTMAEENRAAAGSPIIPDKPMKSTKQRLQEMGDIQRLFEASIRSIDQGILIWVTQIRLRSRFRCVIEENTERARRLRNEGNLSEADMLYRQIMKAMLTLDQDLAAGTIDLSKPASHAIICRWSAAAVELHFEVAAMQQNIGDFAAAEETYERLIIELSYLEYSKDGDSRRRFLRDAIHNLVHLYGLFQQRVIEMDTCGDDSAGYSYLGLSFMYIFHRSSVINSELLDSTIINSFWEALISWWHE